MRFDVGRIVALGADVSMGDHRYPDGSLDPETYRRIGKIYGELETCERWLDGAVPCREAVLLTEIEWGSETRAAFPDETFHAARILEEGGIQFDIRSVNDPLPDYKLVIWPGQKSGSPDLISALNKHVQNGGALLAMNAAIHGLEDIAGVVPVSELPDSSSAERSVETLNAGQIQSPASGFFRLTPGCELYEDWHDFAHIIVQEVPSICAAYGTDVLANHIEALIGQLPCSANYPSDTILGPAIVQRGKVIYSTIPLFTETRMTGTPLPALLIQSLCRKLLDRPLVKHSGGTTVAAHMHKMDEGYTLHLIHWALDRWGKQTNSALEFPILGPIDVELSIKDEVKSIALQPQGDTIPYCQKDDVCRFTVPQMKIWQIVVINT
jgi:hypothetical protein